MADFTIIPLNQRLEAVRDKKVCQPEYLPALIRQWARMPIASYFGPCRKELEQLRAVLGLTPEENPSYQEVAAKIDDLPFCGEASAEALELLAAPVRARQERFQKGRDNNG